MSCEFNERVPCEDCEILYCPDQVEEIMMEYQHRKDIVEQAYQDYTEAVDDLDEYLEDYKEVLSNV